VFTDSALGTCTWARIILFTTGFQNFGFQLFTIICSDIFSVESVVMCSPSSLSHLLESTLCFLLSLKNSQLCLYFEPTRSFFSLNVKKIGSTLIYLLLNSFLLFFFPFFLPLLFPSFTPTSLLPFFCSLFTCLLLSVLGSWPQILKLDTDVLYQLSKYASTPFFKYF
jgi:hypothetical protein